MKIQPGTITHERFKELIKEWLDSHREEYCAFANEVSGRDRQGFQVIFQYAQIIAPQYASALMSHIADGGEDSIGSLEKVLADADIGTSILNDFQSGNPESIAPAMLAWLYFGQSWEVMVAYNEELIQEKSSGFLSRCMARLIIRAAIIRSIALGHRTKEDWEKFRKVQKSMGLTLPVTDSTMPEFENDIEFDNDIEAEDTVADTTEEAATSEKKEEAIKMPAQRGRKRIRKPLEELIPTNTDKIIDGIARVIRQHSKGNHLALLFIFLKEGSHIEDCDITTFHDALNEKFTEHKFVGVRSVQKAHNELLMPMGGGKRIIDIGQSKKDFEMITQLFEKAVA